MEQLTRRSAQELKELRHLTPAIPDEIREQLVSIGLVLRGEYKSFDEDFRRFLKLGPRPLDEGEVLHFCREYLRERPQDQDKVIATMLANKHSHVERARTKLERWIRAQQEA